MQLGYKKKLAKKLANVQEGETEELNHEQADYFNKIFKFDDSKPTV